MSSEKISRPTNVKTPKTRERFFKRVESDITKWNLATKAGSGLLRRAEPPRSVTARESIDSLIGWGLMSLSF